MFESQRGRNAEYCIVHEHCMNSRSGEKSPSAQSAPTTTGPLQLFFRHICILAFIVVGFIFVLLMLPFGVPYEKTPRPSNFTHQSGIEKCSIALVESIPEGLNYSADSPKFMSTHAAWNTLLDVATNSLDIGSFYWTLLGSDIVNVSSAAPGEEVFQRLLNNSIDHKLNIRIAQSAPSDNYPDVDTKILLNRGAADVRTVDFPRLLGGGVLHTKLWIADGKHFYLGSANMDWRSLTQVKELGILAQNCAALAGDVAKIFEAYWLLGTKDAQIPKDWPYKYRTSYNWHNPMVVKFNDNFTSTAFFSNSPPPLTAGGRENDVDALVNTIRSATEFVHISVMDYYPLIVYGPKTKYWPVIDDAIRTAAVENKVSIKMLISWWKHSRATEDYFLRSLSDLSSSLPGVNIEIRRFVVPSNADQTKIPYTRVNHNKYMVTDNTAYIGTSNWSGDYFTDTAGVALVVRDFAEDNNTLRTDLASVFERDWNSPYALSLK